MNRISTAHDLQKLRGFSLLEVSIVLLVMGLLLSSILPSFGAQIAERQRKQTSELLLNIRDAAIGFAAANQRLPCPLDSNGQVSCDIAHGFVPAASLGIDGNFDANGLLVDPWNQPIRYSVSVSDADSNGAADFTSVRGMQEVGMPQLSPEFQVCKVHKNCSQMRANQVPLVLLSTGPSHLDPSADELDNTDGDNRFVSKDMDQVGDDHFDDIVVWLSESVLYSQLIQARVLP